MENSRFKFRAWDKSQNKMYQVRGINFDNEDLWLKINETQIMGANLFEVELMQYTGLKDKNGTEIYEGDIVFDSHCEENGKVIFDEGCFAIEWETTIEDLFENCDIYEVIGNAYQNPELLKEGE